MPDVVGDVHPQTWPIVAVGHVKMRLLPFWLQKFDPRLILLDPQWLGVVRTLGPGEAKPWHAVEGNKEGALARSMVRCSSGQGGALTCCACVGEGDKEGGDVRRRENREKGN